MTKEVKASSLLARPQAATLGKSLLACIFSAALLSSAGSNVAQAQMIDVGGSTCVQNYSLYDYYSNGVLTDSIWEADGITCYDNGGAGGNYGDPYFGGGGGGGGVSPVCGQLLATRPQNCNNRIDKPSGALYGPSYMPDSVMWHATNYVNPAVTRDVYPNVRAALSDALSRQTSMIASGSPLADVNAQLRADIARACTEELQSAMYTPDTNFARRNSFQMCDDIGMRFDWEAGGGSSLLNSIASYFSHLVDWRDLMPYGSNTAERIYNASNSLLVKYEAVVRDSTCANWWDQMGINQCGS